jgi:hypothetical protein
LNKPFWVGFSIVNNRGNVLPELEVVFRYQEGETDSSKVIDVESDFLNNAGCLVEFRKRMDWTIKNFLNAPASTLDIDQYLPGLIFDVERRIENG